MQKASPDPSLPFLKLTAQDRADFRNPQPRDPLAHPHFGPRPVVARRYVVDLAAEANPEQEDTQN